MDKRIRVTVFLLCAALCLAGCGMRQQTSAAETAPTEAPVSQPAESAVPAPETAAPAQETAAPAPESTAAPAGYDRAAYDDAISAILDQYTDLRERGIENFDEAAHPQLPWYSAVVASWAWNGLYYGTYDFDSNGVPELIVAAGTDDFCQPVGIYAFNGSEMLYLCPDQALGERASVTYTDDLFFIHGSGSAATGSIIVYRIAPDGYSTEIVEIMDYEYIDAETAVFTPELGNMTAEELQSHDYLRGFSVPVEYTRFADSHDGGAVPGMPNPWSEAADPEAAAQGAVLNCFVLPEYIGCADYLPEHRILSYMDGLAQAVYDNGTDRLVIRKGSGSTDVSGDYNDYPETGEIVFKGLHISCSGADGQIRLARWEFGGNSYSLSFNAGDYTRPGLTEDQVTSLVNQIQ